MRYNSGRLTPGAGAPALKARTQSRSLRRVRMDHQIGRPQALLSPVVDGANRLLGHLVLGHARDTSVGTRALLQVAVDEVVVVLVGDGSVPAEPIAGGDELARRNAVRSPRAIRIVLADRIPTYVARLEATHRFGLRWQRRLATDGPDHRVAMRDG